MHFMARGGGTHSGPPKILKLIGKSGFASHTKHIVEVTITDLLHS